MSNPQLKDGTVAQLNSAESEADRLVASIDKLTSTNVVSVEAELTAMRATVGRIDASLVRAIAAQG